MTSRPPYVELSAMARVEAHRKNIYRPPYYVHKWWARRTGSVFRGILLDLLLPLQADVMEAYYQAHDFSHITVLDPFMGGGTTIGEGLRLGCKMIGCDLNPVAWYLVTQAMRDVDLQELQQAYHSVADGVAGRIQDMYTTICASCGVPAEAQYVAWTKQVPCTRCGDLASLHTSQVIMADMAVDGAGLVDCPCCGHPWWTGHIDQDIDCPSCGHTFTPARERAPRTHFHCDHCGNEDRILTALARQEAPPTHRMRCLTIWCQRCEKRHQAPTPADVATYERIAADVAGRWDSMRIPREEIPAGFNTDQMRRYGYRYWYQMFNPRQLAALDMLFTAIRRVTDRGSREALTLLASSSLEFNSMFCGAKGLGTGAIRHVFAHHAFIPAKEPLEANLWGVHRSSGGFSTLYKERLLRAREWAAQPVERRFTGAKAEPVPITGERLAGRPVATWQELEETDANLLLVNQSSEALPQIPDGAVDFIVTDPPYADSVMYSELADYFYVWLRLALKDDYPNFAPLTANDEREAVHNPGRGRDGSFYTAVLGNVFSEAHRTLKPGGRMAFTFHHSGQDAWRQLQEALIVSGFVVERWWPVFAEMESSVALYGKENNGHLDIVFVCAGRGAVATPTAQDSIELMTTQLAAKVRLVAADHRALLEATKVQAATWRVQPTALAS